MYNSNWITDLLKCIAQWIILQFRLEYSYKLYNIILSACTYNIIILCDENTCRITLCVGGAYTIIALIVHGCNLQIF